MISSSRDSPTDPSQSQPARSRPRRRRGRVLAVGLVVMGAGLVLTLAVYPEAARHPLSFARQAAGALARRVLPEPPPNVAWETGPPESAGLSSNRLDALRDILAAHQTRTFLVVRHDRLVYEWYGADFGPNRRHFAAAATKGLAGSLALGVAVDDGRIRLDDPAAIHVPEWRDDPMRSRILVRNLASHSSGLQDVNFDVDRPGISDWERTYVLDNAARFPLALKRAAMLYEPGTHSSYSGVGYYPLAYALTHSLQGTDQPTIVGLLQQRVMGPLGIPDRAWRLSYGESYSFDGMELQACGSGGSFTGRAAARIGAMMLNGGAWHETSILSPATVRAFLAPPVALESARDPDLKIPLLPSMGWYLNAERFFRTLPADAFMAVGGGDQFVVVIPSLGLVAVRNGRPLFPGERGIQWDRLDEVFFGPLIASVTSGRALADAAGAVEP